MSVIDEVIAANARFAGRFTDPGLPVKPGRALAVVACMDARLDLFSALGLRPGEAHLIRNAGGIVTEDALRSLVISQRLLGTRAVIVLHHTDCGMLGFRDEELKDRIEAEVGVRPTFSFEAFRDLDGSVRQSLAHVRTCPFLPHREEVRGFVWDVGSGRLREIER